MSSLNSRHSTPLFEKEVQRWNGSYEDSGSGRSWAVLQSRVKRLIELRKELSIELLQVRDGDVVLDLGCGGGYYGLDIQQKCRCSYVGVDISSGMLRYASGLYRGRSVTSEFLNGDITDVPIANASVDKILAVGVLCYYKGDKRMALLSEIRRILKDGGVSVIYTANFDPLNWLRTRLPGSVPRPFRLPGPIHALSNDAAFKLFTKAGLRVEEVVPLRKYGGLIPACALFRVRK